MDKKKCIIDRYNTVYTFDLYVIVNPNQEAIDERFCFKKDETSITDDEWANYTAYTCAGVWDKEKNKECIVVVINKLQDEEQDVNTFAHEAFHVAATILDSCNISLTEDTNEAYAYLVGYAAECMYKTAKKV